MLETMKTFATSEDGASVVDMTMLMAAVTGLALAVGFQVSGGLQDLSGDVESTVAAQDASAAW